MPANASQVKSALDAVGRQLDRDAGEHLYRQIAALLRRRVLDGALRPGDALPSQRELSALWSVAEVTIRRALRDLADEGLLEARPGAGTVVTDAAAPRRDRATLVIGLAFADLVDGYPFSRPVSAGLRVGDRPVVMPMLDLPADCTDDAVARALPLGHLDAMVMMSPVNLPLLAASEARRLPTVLLFSDLSDGYSHCILPDYANGVIEAVAHLVRQNRKRIAMVTASAERFSTGRWLSAYRAALSAFRLEARPDWMVQAGYAERDGAHALRELMSLDQRPDAVLFASDFMARGGLLAAHEIGLKIPDDLAIIGAGPVLDAGGWTVPLATIDLGLFDMGRLARQAIDAVIDGRTDSPLRQSVTARFCEGKTA